MSATQTRDNVVYTERDTKRFAVHKLDSEVGQGGLKRPYWTGIGHCRSIEHTRNISASVTQPKALRLL